MRTGLGVRLGLAVAIISLIALSLGAGSASARTFRANLLGDPTPNGCTAGNCSLREAVLAANSRSGFDSIVLRPGKVYRLALVGLGEELAATGDLDVTDPLAVSTPKFRRTPSGRRRARPATIDGGGIDRILDLSDPLTLRRLVLRNGHAQAPEQIGGAIAAEDTDSAALNAFDVRFLDNHADQYGGALALHNGSNFLFVRTVFKGNRGDSDSGVVDIELPGAAEDHRVTFRRVRALNNDSGGQGGVGWMSTAIVRVIRSRLAFNTADNNGGAIHNSDARITVLRSTVSANRSGAAGGGIHVGGGTTTILNSTISGNRAMGDGGGVRNAETLTVINSTIANNSADGAGGGVANATDAGVETSLNAVTVARNRANADGSGGDDGGGVYQAGASTFSLANSLIALNTIGPGGVDPSCSGTFTSDHNLFTTNDAGCIRAPGTGDISTGAPRIGPLSKNGGPTKTIPLRRGSPAINEAGATAPNRDQRGVRKFRRRDIGAFERRPSR
jgi:CSLREA domain-containing protein